MNWKNTWLYGFLVLLGVIIGYAAKDNIGKPDVKIEQNNKLKKNKGAIDFTTEPFIEPFKKKKKPFLKRIFKRKRKRIKPKNKKRL